MLIMRRLRFAWGRWDWGGEWAVMADAIALRALSYLLGRVVLHLAAWEPSGNVTASILYSHSAASDLRRFSDGGISS